MYKVAPTSTTNTKTQKAISHLFLFIIFFFYMLNNSANISNKRIKVTE